MIRQFSSQLVWHTMVCVLVAIPALVSAQHVDPTAPQDWRSANDAVGQLKRGHIDVLKWEQMNPAPTSLEPVLAQPAIALPTVEAAIQQAWRAHFDLQNPLARLGAANVALIAAGRWAEVDPALQRRVDDMGAVYLVAIQAKKAWLQAVAARQALAPYRATVDAAQAANALGQRMVGVGNWSKLKQAPLQIAESSAQMGLIRAQYAAVQAQANLLKILGLKGQYASVVLPDALPEVPVQPVPASEWRQRAVAIQAQLPGAESVRSAAHIDMALAAYQARHALVLASRDVLKVREVISEETVLHYNGMLSSVWDVLAESGNQSQAAVDVIAAQRDFWIAEGDLQWVLQGGEPDSFVAAD